ncbi:MAG: FeoA domain-containing protein [Ignavibacteriaceae bacterium]|jgi:Fe2+ transport system protein FeoA|nr:FeoA domain-containing protein [Ignavibacteriaceae bacterium]
MKKASQLNFGEKVVINDIDVLSPHCNRLLEVGFTPGQQIELVHKSFFDDPLAFALRGTIIAIRKHEADSITVI